MQSRTLHRLHLSPVSLIAIIITCSLAGLQGLPGYTQHYYSQCCVQRDQQHPPGFYRGQARLSFLNMGSFQAVCTGCTYLHTIAGCLHREPSALTMFVPFRHACPMHASAKHIAALSKATMQGNDAGVTCLSVYLKRSSSKLCC